MMFVCPKCGSKIFTPTGVEVEMVDCRNCGIQIEGTKGINVAANSASNPSNKNSFWSRVCRFFGTRR